MIQRFFKNEGGNIITLTAAAILAMLASAAITIDVGSIMAARNQLQCGVDAAALAGASGFTVGKTEATSRAIYYGGLNDVQNQPVALSSADITFPSTSRIRVRGTHAVRLFFGGLIRLESVDISAIAAAELGYLTSTDGLRPWAVPDLGWNPGDDVILKVGELGVNEPDDPAAPGRNSSFFYPVDYPALNNGNPETGASVYEANILDGSDYIVEIGDVILVEPGNMVGPTNHAVTELINRDPTAYCTCDGEGCEVVSPCPGEYGSPRIIKIPLYDVNEPPASGRNTIVITGLAAFFIESIQGRNVIGKFMTMTTSGGFGNGNTMLRGVKLVE